MVFVYVFNELQGLKKVTKVGEVKKNYGEGYYLLTADETFDFPHSILLSVYKDENGRLAHRYLDFRPGELKAKALYKGDIDGTFVTRPEDLGENLGQYKIDRIIDFKAKPGLNIPEAMKTIKQRFPKYDTTNRNCVHPVKMFLHDYGGINYIKDSVYTPGSLRDALK